jgi:cell wall-associated NlpC family hydrolase
VVGFPYTVTNKTTLYAKWQHISPYLTGVSLSAGTLSRTFKKNVYSYKVLLGENDGSVKITPIKENDNAAMMINGVITSSVPVSIENGKTKTEKVKVIYAGHARVYTFVVKRAKSTNDDLASLTASAGTFNVPFDPSVTNYTLNLDEFTFKVCISASKLSPLSTLRIDGRQITSKTYSLKQGESVTSTLSMRSQTGATKPYTVVISRAENTYPDKVSALIGFAKTNLGKPYTRGGKGPDSFDCSGFVYYCLKSIGTQINYMTSAVWPTSSWTTIASIGDMLPGDILCFQGHVGIYLGSGMMINASSSAGCVRISSCVSPYWISNFICGKRVLNNP